MAKETTLVYDIGLGDRDPEYEINEVLQGEVPDSYGITWFGESVIVIEKEISYGVGEERPIIRYTVERNIRNEI